MLCMFTMLVVISVTLIRKLESLGFKALDCERALQICNGDLEHAASWLADNVTPIAVVQAVPDTKSKGSINIAAVDVSWVAFYPYFFDLGFLMLNILSDSCDV